MSKKSALITGGCRGIGLAISRELLKNGFILFINSRDSGEKYKEVIEDLKNLGEVHHISFDVTNKESVNSAANDFGDKHLDLLINNAGINRDNLISSQKEEDWDSVISTNYTGSIQVYNAFKSNLRKSEKPVVINIASIAGVKPRSGQGAYAVSKAMIIEWTKSMAQQNKDIDYYSISPGPIATEMIKNAPWYNKPGAKKRIPLRRFGEPEEIGEIAVSLFNTPRFIESGSNIIFDGGFTGTTRE